MWTCNSKLQPFCKIKTELEQVGCNEIPGCNKCKLDGCIMMIKHNTVFASNRSAICNRCFPGPTRVLNANGISIASEFSAGLTRWQTDRRTDHATQSFTISGIYLCSKRKERKSIYIAPFVCYVYLKALRHGSHSFTYKYTMPAFPLSAFTSADRSNRCGVMAVFQFFKMAASAILYF